MDPAGGRGAGERSVQRDGARDAEPHEAERDGEAERDALNERALLGEPVVEPPECVDDDVQERGYGFEDAIEEKAKLLPRREAAQVVPLGDFVGSDRLWPLHVILVGVALGHHERGQVGRLLVARRHRHERLEDQEALLGLPREEFPAFPAVKFDGGWRAPAKDLQKLVGHVAFAASTEESRPILNGVLWELRAERMRMVATNGHRLARMDVPASAMGGGQADLIVPPKALDQLRRLFEGDEDIEIGRSDNHLGFRSTTTQVYTRLIEGPYPNYEQVIPRENDKIATVDRQTLASALRRVGVVASDQTHRVRLAFSGGSLRFSVNTPDLGEAHDEIAVSYQGDPLEIGFNASYVLEILKYMPTDEVRLGFKAPERAATVEPVGWDDPAAYLCLVMPLRLVD